MKKNYNLNSCLNSSQQKFKALKNTLFTLAFIVAISVSVKAQTPVDYTLQASDVTIVDGRITKCTYDFSANIDGTNLTIPNDLGVTGISDGETDWMGYITGTAPFAEQKITSIKLPTGFEYLGDFAFSKNDLTKLLLPNSLIVIGRDVFFENNIDSVFIPSSVKSIGMNSFYSNAALDTIVFETGSHLISIGSHAFENTLVTKIKLPTPIVPNNTFEYWLRNDGKGTTHQGGDIVTPDFHSFLAKYDYTLTNDDVVMEQGVMQSCSYDFSSKFIIIPEMLDGQSVIGIAGTNSQKEAIFYGKTLREITLPSTLQTIGKMSFNSNSIDTLIIPANVTKIGDFAFWGFSLDTVMFENNCKIDTIGLEAFDNNSNLKMEFPIPVKDGFTFNNWIDYDDNIFNGGDEITNFATSYTARFSLAAGTSIIALEGNLAFGNVTNTTTSTATLTLSNTGNAVYAVSSIELPVGYTADWTSGDVAVDGEQEIVITFAPTEAKEYNGTVEVNSNAVAGTNTMDISGVGINEELQSITTLADINVDYGTLENNITFQASVDITTTGTTNNLSISDLTWLCDSYDKNTPATYAFTTDIASVLSANNIEAGSTSTTISVNVIVGDNPDGINDKNNIDFAFYPNPVNSTLTIETNELYAIDLIDANGKVLIHKQATEFYTKLDMSKQAKGVYILRLTNESGFAVKQIVKQ